MLKKNHCFQNILKASFMLLLTGLVGAVAIGHQIRPKDQDKLQLAEKVADHHIRQLRQTFNFREIAREMFRSHAASLYGGFEVRGLNPQEGKLEAEKTEKIYVAFMNYYYLSLVYDAAIKRATPEQTKKESISPEIATVIKSSKYFGAVEAPLGIPLETSAQIEEYIAEAEHLASLYRQYMPEEALDSQSSKAVRATSKVINGDAELGPNAKIYKVVRGIFSFSFIEGQGELKVYELSIDR